MINILIADDHPVVRRGLKNILQEQKDMKVAFEASNSDEVLEILKQNKVDILLLDISMPGKSGLDLLNILENQKSDLPVLVLSALPEESYAKRVIKMGAKGYIHKESAIDSLVTAVRTVLSGKIYISSKLAELLAQDLVIDENKKPHELLSEREFQVLLLLGKSKTVSQIAETLFLSVTTISTYRARVLEKMKLKNNSELIQYCIKNNLIEN